MSALLLTLLAGLAVGESVAEAKRVTLRDDQGRPIHFDVRRARPNLEAYAQVLRRISHGDEIGRVVIQIGPRRRPSSNAYRVLRHTRPGRIVLPRATLRANRGRLIHAYGHHVDFSRRGTRCPVAPCSRRGLAGGAGWFAARGLARHIAAGRIGGDEREGGRRVSHLWADDFLALHGDRTPSLGWLAPAGAAITRAMAADLERLGIREGGGSPDGAETVRSAPSAWVVLERRGRLPIGGTAQLRFAGPRRAIDYVGEVTGVGGLAGVRNALLCDAVRRTGTWASDGAPAHIRARALPGAICSVTITNVGSVPVDYAATLKVSRAR